MPSEVMDQRGGTASVRLFDDIAYPHPAERQIGFLKSQTMPDYCGETDGIVGIPGNKFVAQTALEKLSPSGPLVVDDMDMAQSSLVHNKEEAMEGSAYVFKSSSDQHTDSWPSLSSKPGSYGFDRDKACFGGFQWESTLFSSSMSELFSRKLRLTANDVKPQSGQDVLASQKEEEHLGSLEELEAQTIGSLLPAEDDLFSGVTDVLGCTGHANVGDDLEDFDLFSSGGGLELEGDELLPIGQRLGENPSRTLFVRNISSSIEDSELKLLFQQYGDVRTLGTACKHRGFVMISYYDIRAAQKAMKSLQNKPLKCRNLHVHYSIPKENPTEKDVNQGGLVVFNLDPSVSTDELRQIFGAYGEIKEVCESMHRSHQKFVEYYDMRAAEAALSALNGRIIAGKQIKLEPRLLGGTRSLIQHSKQDGDETTLCHSPYGGLSSGRMRYSPGVIGSSHKDNESLPMLHSAIQSPVSGFIEPCRSSSVPNSMLSPVNMAYVGKQFGLGEPNRSLSDLKSVNQCALDFHPHSLPEYNDNLANGVPYNSTSAIGSMGGSVGPNLANGLGGRNSNVVGSNGHPMERNGQVFGSSGNGSCTLPGNHYMWNNSPSGQQQSSWMMWPNSLSYANGAHLHPFSHIPGFPRAHSVMLNAAPAHHVGSAPAVNPSLWDRRNSFSGESPDISGFHLGSLGSVGLPGCSPTHPTEIASLHMFYNAGGMDLTKNAGFCSPQQMSHMFPGRNEMTPMAGSFGSPNERGRSLSHRRTEANSSENKKQYELDIDRILCGEDSRTTLMIKNIPNKYTSKMLLAAIDEHCRGTYNFIYLPIDFKNKCNVGYAFINMIDAQQIIAFYKAFNGKKWEKFNSEKVASLAYARIQGKAALIAHFQNSSLMNEDKRCRPILFHTDGPNAGDPEPFPMGTNIRSRLGKPRTSNEENNHHSIPSAFSNGEDTCNGTDSASGSD